MTSSQREKIKVCADSVSENGPLPIGNSDASTERQTKHINQVLTEFNALIDTSRMREGERNAIN